MSWYLPAGKSGDLFSRAITFLNLHGDARNHLEQLDVLSQISSMCVFVLLEHDLEFDTQCMDILNTIYTSPGGLTVLNGCDREPFFKQSFPKLYLINLGDKTATRRKSTIQSLLTKKIEKITAVNSMEHLVHEIRHKKIVTDESNDLYIKGLQKANQIKKIIVDYKSKELSVKEAMFPLQGDKLWRAWTYCDREVRQQILNRSESVNQYTEKMNRQQTAIRNQQLEHVKKLSFVMKLFIDGLNEFSDKHSRNFFLQYLKLELSCIYRDNMFDQQQRYQLIRNQLFMLCNETGNAKNKFNSEISALYTELNHLQEDLSNSLLGLQDLLRELGQVYEAALQSKEYADYYSYLPRIAAELLIEGYPLELVNGDATHIPLEWVTAVLKEVVTILHNPNVFVVSVLGLQGTGKSTMLNTVFGLQFNVSVSRCTRGAFMQLLSLDEDLQDKTNCNYILVVDTQGLRAPELDPQKTQKHDNELATFVIGLANMTLMNIYGEVPGDMDDILQTSVHAFLRMNKVKCHPSCQYVHQNTSLNIKGKVGRTRFAQKLNQFTLDAAREEHCEGQYETFNDVIKFDHQTDVHYFPGLWKGDPPMAPVNQEYSHTAQFLNLVDIICRRTSQHNMASHSGEKFSDLSLQSFSIKISDLWEALLKDDFVFSFKNTLEIKAYNSLEKAYTKWEWTIQSSMLEWEQKAENEIRTEFLQSALSKHVQEKHRELALYVENNLYKPLQQEMERFFNGKQSEILAQWRSRFEVRLSTLISEVKQHAQQHCDKLLKFQEALSEFEKNREKYGYIMKEKVKQHIQEVNKDHEQLKISLITRQLNRKQLQSLIAKDLFSPEKLKMYVNQQLISSESGDFIHEIIRKRRQLDDVDMKVIIEKSLDVDQVEIILKMTRPIEKELKHTFESIWQDLIKSISPVKSTSRDIPLEVEKELIKFSANFKGTIIQIIQEKMVIERQNDFIPVKDIHYKYKLEEGAAVLKKMPNVFWNSSPHQQLVLQITNNVFDEAEQFVKKITAHHTDFHPALTAQLLRTVKAAIEKFSEISEDTIKFTPRYYVEIYVRACFLAVPHFKEIALKFEEKNNSIEYLEKNVKPLFFTKFKNQYKQTESEEAIAETLCAYLEEPIKLQVQKTLGSKIVNKMKASEHYFCSKMALKVKILTDLYEQNDFRKYMIYVRQVKKCLTDYIRKYTGDYCDEVLSTGSTRLQVTAKEEVSRLVTVVKNVVYELNVKKNSEWLQNFSSNTTLRAEIGANIEANDLGYDSLEELNLENIKQNIYAGLDKFMTKCHAFFDTIMFGSEIDNWKDKPHELLKSLIGCTEQCPFCGEQCDLLEHDPSEHEHRIEIHLPICLASLTGIETEVMTVDACPTKIAGRSAFKRPDGKYHPYNGYKEVYPDWSIPPNSTSNDSLYWKWFMGQYRREIAERIGPRAPHIPTEWSHIQWDEVKQYLENSYNVEV